MPGIQALPLIIAQSDAVLSLVDPVYYGRAWCCTEAGMVETLRKSYNMHAWYEQVIRPQHVDGEPWVLKEAASGFDIIPSTQAVTYEVDRARIRFLERRSRLLEWI